MVMVDGCSRRVINKGPFGCNFISNIEALYLTEMELKSKYKVIVW